jgi:hypothetical protein
MLRGIRKDWLKASSGREKTLVFLLGRYFHQNSGLFCQNFVFLNYAICLTLCA